MGGAAYIFATLVKPGTIVHSGGPARVVFGEMNGARSLRATRLLQLCEQAHVDSSLADDIRRVLWEKFMFITAQAGLTSVIRLPIGPIRDVPDSWKMFQQILREVLLIARAEGVDLEDEVVERHTAFALRLEPDSYSSMYYDLTDGKRMELEALHGMIVRLADQHGHAAPMSRAVYALLKPWALRNEHHTY